jgi:hypothetical protein
MALEGANNEPVVLVKDTEGRLQDSEVERTSIGLPSPLDVLFSLFFLFYLIHIKYNRCWSCSKVKFCILSHSVFYHPEVRQLIVAFLHVINQRRSVN